MAADLGAGTITATQAQAKYAALQESYNAKVKAIGERYQEALTALQDSQHNTFLNDEIQLVKDKYGIDAMTLTRRSVVACSSRADWIWLGRTVTSSAPQGQADAATAYFNKAVTDINTESADLTAALSAVAELKTRKDN